jgi:hypothetical protein
MLKIKRYLKKLVDRYMPNLVTLNAEDVRTIFALYQYEAPSFITDNAEMTALSVAIERIEAQLPFFHDGELHEYLLYVADCKALADMCNKYCLQVADSNEKLHPLLRGIATLNYGHCTNIMLKLAA